jgi:plastocyanin
VQVDTAQLVLNSPPNGLGAGQMAPNQMYVSMPSNVFDSTTVNLASSDPAILTVPAQVVIPKGTYYVYFPVTGTGVGSANVTATAATAKPAVPVPVRISTPKFQVFVGSSTIAGQKTTVTVYSEDSTGTTRNPAAPLTVTLVSSVPGHTTFDSTTIRIPTNVYYASTAVVFDTAGSYTITASNPGFTSGNATTVTTGALVRMVSPLTFAPGSVTIKAGQYVTWRNDDATNHTTTEDTGPTWNSGALAPGASFQRSFSTPGTFTYHCAIHAGMTGTVTVTP